VILSKGERTVGKTHRVIAPAHCYIGANWVQEGLPKQHQAKKDLPVTGEARKWET